MEFMPLQIISIPNMLIPNFKNINLVTMPTFQKGGMNNLLYILENKQIL